MCVAGFGKEFLSGSLSTSSMMHVEGMFCLGRRCGEIGDGGSDLDFFLIRVGELKASGGVGLVRIWVGVIVGGLYAPVFHCVGVILALQAMGSKVSGGGCNIGALRVGLLMLVSPMGWSLGYTSSFCSEKIG